MINNRMGARLSNKRVVYGINCVWWDTIGKVAIKEGTGLPCCPHCGSVLMEIDSLETWWANVAEYENSGHSGYQGMMEWSRGKCFPDMKSAKAAFEAHRNG